MINTPESYSTFNKYLYYHLFSVSGYEAVGVRYYNDYLRNMTLGSPLVDLLNIRYIILPKGTQINDQGVDVGDKFGPYTVVMNSDALLLENPYTLPRAFPVSQAQVVTDKERILEIVSHPSFDARETVVIEEELPPGYRSKRLNEEISRRSQSKVEITSYLNRTIRLHVNMADDEFLVLSEKYYPGWVAYVNGRPTKIYKANYTLQAIYLPKGEHEITFAFQPKQFILGLVVTFMTGVGLLGVAVYTVTHKKQPL
jgi:hypothetical protein